MGKAQKETSSATDAVCVVDGCGGTRREGFTICAFCAAAAPPKLYREWLHAAWPVKGRRWRRLLGTLNALRLNRGRN